MNEKTIISILIPCLNEEKYIDKCLQSVCSFRLPENCETEIFVIDGMSSDNTRNIVQKIVEGHSNIKLIDNPGRIQSCALNTAIPLTKGSFILRLDAHSEYPDDYLYILYNASLEKAADNYGGLFITRPGGDTYQAQLVQALTTHMFGVGNSGFRLGYKSDYADSVPYGFFRRDVFEKYGYFDERLKRCQDYEFNRRIIKNGGKIWRCSDVSFQYYNQPSVYKFLKKQLIKEGPYNAYMWYLAPYTFAYRHVVPAVFAAGVISGVILSVFFNFMAWAFLSVMAIYSIMAVFSAVQQAIRFKLFRHVLFLPFCFFLYHFIYGLGILSGIIKVLLHIAPVQKVKEPWKGAGKKRVNDILKM